MQIKYSLVNVVGAILGFISLGLNWMNVNMTDEYTSIWDLLAGGSGTIVDESTIPINLNEEFLGFLLDGYSNIPTIIIVGCIIALVAGISIEDPQKDQPIYKIFSILTLIAGILLFVAVIYLYSILNEFYNDPDHLTFSIMVDIGAILAIVGGSVVILGLFTKKIPSLQFINILLYSS